jgi:hypothetical protein
VTVITYRRPHVNDNDPSFGLLLHGTLALHSFWLLKVQGSEQPFHCLSAYRHNPTQHVRPEHAFHDASDLGPGIHLLISPLNANSFPGTSIDLPGVQNSPTSCFIPHKLCEPRRKSNYLRVATTAGRGTFRTAVMDDKGEGARKKSEVVSGTIRMENKQSRVNHLSPQSGRSWLHRIRKWKRLGKRVEMSEMWTTCKE